jgi:hypothetical protein
MATAPAASGAPEGGAGGAASKLLGGLTSFSFKAFTSGLVGGGGAEGAGAAAGGAAPAPAATAAERAEASQRELILRTRDLTRSTTSLERDFLAREVSYAGGAAGNYSRTQKEVAAVRAALAETNGAILHLATALEGSHALAAKLAASGPQAAVAAAPAAAAAAPEVDAGGIAAAVAAAEAAAAH